MCFSPETPPTSPVFPPHRRIPSVFSHIWPRFFSHHSFHPFSSKGPQPWLLHPLIRPCILPYPADIPHPLALLVGSFLSSPHPILFAPFLSPSAPGLVLFAPRLPPSSLASNSPPDTFPCLLTNNCTLDYLTKPAQFITIP